jgi:hypothetical protein
MKLVHSIPLVVLAGCLVASCSHAPRLATAPAARDDYRAEYLRNNPDGKFNPHIKKGEVVKGMAGIEVLASWGLPNFRRSGRAEISEYWIYFSLDDHTKTYTVYELGFKERVLAKLVIEDNIHSYDALVQRNLIGLPVKGREGLPGEGSGSLNDGGAVKKKP